MRRTLASVGVWIAAGAVLNVGVAWAMVIVHGRVELEGIPHHNPRGGDPVVFFVERRVGVEWVVGCGRPGTFRDRYPEQVQVYHGAPWWPARAVTFDEWPCGQAAGWPMLSFAAWRSLESREEPDEDGDPVSWYEYHGGVLLEGTTKGGWDELPAILPMRPIWSGLVVNTLAYAIGLYVMVAGPGVVRRWVRRARGLCEGCGYPRAGGGRCPECGGVLAPVGGGVK